MKTCKKCGNTLPLSKFTRDNSSKDGLKSWCAACLSQKQREWREKNLDRSREINRQALHNNADARAQYQRERTLSKAYRARRALNSAVYRGSVVKPGRCQVCGKTEQSFRIHGHHASYDFPFLVIWCCPFCHVGLDRERQACEERGISQLLMSDSIPTTEKIDTLLKEIEQIMGASCLDELKELTASLPAGGPSPSSIPPAIPQKVTER